MMMWLFQLAIRLVIVKKLKSKDRVGWASTIAVNLCKDVGIFYIILEGDSQQAVDKRNQWSISKQEQIWSFSGGRQNATKVFLIVSGGSCETGC